MKEKNIFNDFFLCIICSFFIVCHALAVRRGCLPTNWDNGNPHEGSDASHRMRLPSSTKVTHKNRPIFIHRLDFSMWSRLKSHDPLFTKNFMHVLLTPGGGGGRGRTGVTTEEKHRTPRPALPPLSPLPPLSLSPNFHSGTLTSSCFTRTRSAPRHKDSRS